MNKYKVIFTHNPQDFFNGSEPGELTEIRPVRLLGLRQILRKVDEGYKAVIVKGGDGNG